MKELIGVLFFLLLVWLIYHYIILPDSANRVAVVKKKEDINYVPAPVFNPNQFNVVN